MHPTMTATLTFLIAVALSGIALAHALLQSAMPTVGSTAQTAPAWVTLVFGEAIEPRFSRIEVRDDKGQRADKSDSRSTPDDPKRLVVDLKPLGPGTYKVTWHVVSADTHKTEGSYEFRVGG